MGFVYRRRVGLRRAVLGLLFCPRSPIAGLLARRLVDEPARSGRQTDVVGQRRRLGR
jgi:hypothetical protein